MGIDLDDLLNGLMADMKKVTDTASMIGEPVKVGSSHMVPLLGVTIGFGTATTDVSGNGETRGGRVDGGGAGGTMVVTPRAFVVVGKDGIPQLVALRDGKYGAVQKSIELTAAPAQNGVAELTAGEPTKKPDDDNK
jgi:uncharacterized spore protein YtfJ